RRGGMAGRRARARPSALLRPHRRRHGLKEHPSTRDARGLVDSRRAEAVPEPGARAGGSGGERRARSALMDKTTAAVSLQLGRARPGAIITPAAAGYVGIAVEVESDGHEILASTVVDQLPVDHVGRV